MERLTQKNPCGLWTTGECEEHYDEQPDGTCISFCYGEAIDRLAAYEDTGLTPEEVKLIANALREVGETYNCWFNYVAQCVIEHSKLQELVQAEKDGRLAVLPCKVGDTVYRVFTPKGREPVIVPCEIKTVGQAADLAGRIGKKCWLVSTYLTHQEAETALREAAENG